MIWKRKTIRGAMVVESPDINATVMSWGMMMSTPIKLEASIPIDEWMFEIWLVHKHGWCGPDKYDYDELEIAKYPLWYFDPKIREKLGEEDYESIRHTYDLTTKVSLSIERIEKGDFDNITKDAYYASRVGDIVLYKRAIERFRNLIAFL